MLKDGFIMKIKQDEIIQKAPEVIRSLFQNIPFVIIKNVASEKKLEEYTMKQLVTIHVGNNSHTLVLESNSNGEPKYARLAIADLHEYIKNKPSYVGVFLAPYISPQSALMCAQNNIATVDLSGNCHIAFDHVYIERTGNPNKYAEKRDIRSLFSPKASRILRVLLVNRKKSWKTQELADEARVSLGQVANVKKLLADREWILESDAGIALSNPGELLADWSENYTYAKSEVYEYYSLKQPSDIESDLASFCSNNDVLYALTGFSGANRTAPSVRHQRVMSYVSSISDNLKDHLQLKEVVSGANVSFMVPYDEGVYYGYSEKNNIRVVSSVQLYLDLKNYKGRGEEAAETILKQVIQKTW